MEAGVQSLETILSTTNSILASSTASLESSISAEAAATAFAVESLEVQVRYTDRCVHGTPEVYFNSSFCNCYANYSGPACDVLDSLVCDEDFYLRHNIDLAGVQMVRDLYILGSCSGHKLAIPATLKQIWLLKVLSPSTQNLNNFKNVKMISNIEIVDIPSLTDLSGLTQLEQGGNIKIVNTGVESINIPNMRDPFARIEISRNYALKTLHIDTLVSITSGVVIVSDNPVMTIFSGFAHVTQLRTFRLEQSPKLYTLDAFPNLKTVGTSSTSEPDSGVYMIDNPMMAEGDFLVSTAWTGLRGTTVSLPLSPQCPPHSTMRL